MQDARSRQKSLAFPGHFSEHSFTTFPEGVMVYAGPIFDADSHIHEKDYTFFREYLPKDLQKDWLIDRKRGPDGRFGLHIGDRYLENSEANPEGLVPPPGRLKEWLRAMKAGESILSGWIQPTPDMDDRDSRMAKLDEFGVSGALLFPGEILAAIAYLEDPNVAAEVLFAYNRYMAERWGFNVGDKLYPTPFLGLWNLERAIDEAEWLIARGARTVLMPMGPYNGLSPADSTYDPFWQLLNEAGVAVTFHISDCNFLHPMLRQWGEKPFQPRRRGQSAFTWMFGFSDLAVQMTLSSFIFYNFFDRFPRIRLCSVENGAKWLPAFLDKMDLMRGMAKNGYWPSGQLKQRPSEIFKEHCFIVAYPEDDVKMIVDSIGTDRCILMGSDYPHAEGVPTPRDFATEALKGLGADQVRNIMHDNGRRFLPV